MNRMDEIAKMFDLELEEEFTFVASCRTNPITYKFTDDGLYSTAKGYCVSNPLMHMLNGRMSIKKLPFKPKESVYYWFVDIQHNQASYFIWNNSITDNHLYNIGLICRTRQQAENKLIKIISSFNLAVNRKFKKEGEEQQADFISCKVFGKTAEFMSEYMGKGAQIALEGRIQTGSYEKDGVKRFTTDVMVEGVYFADSKKPVSGGDAQEPAQSQGSSDGFILMETDDELPF